MKRAFIAVCLAALAAFLTPPVLAGEYDGVWLGDGTIECVAKGVERISPTIKIDDGKITAEYQGRNGIYSLQGYVDRYGRVKNAFMLGTRMSPILKIRGKFLAKEGNMTFRGSTNAAGGAGESGANACGGGMILTRVTSVAARSGADGSFSHSDYVPRRESAQAGQYDGVWEGDGYMKCDMTQKITFKSSILVEQDRFENRIEDDYVNHILRGALDSRGELREGQLKFSAPQLSSLNFRMSGRATNSRLTVRYENMFSDGVIMAGEHTCQGSINFTKQPTASNESVASAEPNDANSFNRDKSSNGSVQKSTSVTEIETSNPGDNDTIEESLVRLKNLLDQGLITAEDASTWRRELLGLPVASD